MNTSILILDDLLQIRKDLKRHLERESYAVCTAASIEEVNAVIQTESINFAIIDLKIGPSSEYGGIKAIENINKIQPQTKVIVLSAYPINPEIENLLAKVDYYGYIHKGGEQNYITAIQDEIKKLREDPPKKKCFVIMPFSTTKSCTEDEWTDIFENMIKPAVEESGFQYICFRSNLKIGNIIKDILVNLNRAEIVIADLTDQNPNVFYELGVRHALRNATILIAQDIKKDIPFDLLPYATLSYKWKTRKGREKFKQDIKEVFTKIEIDPNGVNVMSPIREYLEL